MKQNNCFIYTSRLCNHKRRTLEDSCIVKKSNDIFIAILTNGRPEPQYAKVVALGLHKWFDDEHIFISGGIGYQKPDLVVGSQTFL